MKELTRAEEQIMHVLWDLERAFVREVIDRLPEPKPAYNTVSTIVRILEKKGFVGHEAFGKTFRYHPRISKERYTRAFLRGFVRDFFDDSYGDLVSFFARDRQVSLPELEGMLQALRDEIQKHKVERLE